MLLYKPRSRWTWDPSRKFLGGSFVDRLHSAPVSCPLDKSVLLREGRLLDRLSKMPA